MERDLIKQYIELTGISVRNGEEVCKVLEMSGRGVIFVALVTTGTKHSITIFGKLPIVVVSDHFWDINAITEEEAQLFLIDTSKWFNKHPVDLQYPTNLKLLMQAVMKSYNT